MAYVADGVPIGEAHSFVGQLLPGVRHAYGIQKQLRRRVHPASWAYVQPTPMPRRARPWNRMMVQQLPSTRFPVGMPGMVAMPQTQAIPGLGEEFVFQGMEPSDFEFRGDDALFGQGGEFPVSHEQSEALFGGGADSLF